MKHIMKSAIFKGSIIAAAVATSQAVMAQDGVIYFTGAIVDQTCTINGGTPDLTVDMGSASRNALAAAGNTSGGTSFAIDLTACTADTPVRTRFLMDGGVDLASGEVKTDNTGGGGDALRIRLYNAADAAGIPIKIGSSGDQGSSNVNIVGGAARLEYVAKFVRTASAAPLGVGPVTGRVAYELSYN